MATYEMSLDLNVLNHLGINLYTKIPAVLSETVANAYDADATEVKITISDDMVIIKDNGCGMSREEVNKRFLTVGYEKRLEQTETPIYHRKPMGKKGIGKLSLFSIANIIEIQTCNGKTKDAFQINVNELKTFISNKENSKNHLAYEPKELIPTISEQGTTIKLTQLRKNRTLKNPEKIKTELARRFNVFSKNFSVYVNDKIITLLDRKYFENVEKLYVYGSYGFDATNVCKKLKYDIEKRDNSFGEKPYKVDGWIGFVSSPEYLKASDEGDEENVNKIFLFCRGKLGQEDILSSIKNSSNYNQYLVGVINADFFDTDGTDNIDMATTSRENFNQESDEYKALKTFLIDEIKHIGNDWNKLKENEGVKQAIAVEPAIAEWFEKLSKDDKKAAQKVLGNINKVVTKEENRKELTKYGILAFEKLRYTHNLSLIDELAPESYKDIGVSLSGIDDLEASLYYQIVKTRLDVLNKFKEITSRDENALEKVIQSYLFKHLWLLDPSWERPTSNSEMEVTIKSQFDENVKLTDEEKKARLDICFKNFAGKTVVIELKRYKRRVTLGELVDQVGKYSTAIEKCLLASGESTKNYEIIVVLGQVVDGDRERIEKTLSQSQARIVYYSKLISDAQSAYKSYFEKHDELNDIIEIFKKLDE